MDLFVDRVEPSTNRAELRFFLQGFLQQFHILAFDILKLPRKEWAIITLCDVDNGMRFLQKHGGPIPLHPIPFRQRQLRFKQSTRRGQPDKLKVQVLKEKEAKMRANVPNSMKKEANALTAHVPILSFQTGIWEYDRLEKLVFDSKFKDLRQGTVIFGKSSLVIYLAANVHALYAWHCRIDIRYTNIEHAILTHSEGTRSALNLTLRSPPKIYKLINTEDLRHYSGKEPSNETYSLPTLDNLILSAISKRIPRGLVRQCNILQSLSMNAALCLVYRVTMPDIDSAKIAWKHIKQSHAISKSQMWKTTVPARRTDDIETEYAQLCQALRKAKALTFEVKFQVLALIFEGIVAPATMSALLENVLVLYSKHGSATTASALRSLGHQVPSRLSPDIDAHEASLETMIKMLKKNIEEIQAQEATAKAFRNQNQHQHLVQTYKVIVKPTGLMLRGPDEAMPNRILRKYSKYNDHFIRVYFTDENGLPVSHDPRADQCAVYLRFRRVLNEGLELADRKFSFLGFSNSSLRCHSAWFMAPFKWFEKLVTAEDIIRDLGDFSHIQCSAKCAARIGQAFTDTIFAVDIPNDAVVITTKSDVERNGRCFSDGCGTISLELMKTIWKRLPIGPSRLEPTVLQIRYGGSKGVVSLDTSLPGKQLHIRKSMTKYPAKEEWRDLEICGASYRPLDFYLNHQFIKILEDLGVARQDIIAVQDDAMRELDLNLKHPLNTASFLEYCYTGVAAKIPLLIKLMHEIGIYFQIDRFLTDVVEVAAMSALRDLKYRARIPVRDGFVLYGIMDETGELNEGEVYITTAFRDELGETKRETLVRDRVVVTRAPALHPGDIQVVKAVKVSDNSPLQDLYNCIVFSQHGQRDLPSQLSGGDLDGDTFHVLYDERLIPPRTARPADYPPTPAKILGRPVQTKDITDFFVEYMTSDVLGMVSNKHKIRADLHPEGTKHDECVLLAKIASDAVDYGKSGNPVDLAAIPKGRDEIRPDYMANAPHLVINAAGAPDVTEDDPEDAEEPDRISVLDPGKSAIRYYRSEKVLGELYRKIDHEQFFARMKRDFQDYQQALGDENLMQKLERYIDRETLCIEWEHHRTFAEQLRNSYEEGVFQTMQTMRPHDGKPLTELEVISGNMLGKKERASTQYVREANKELRECYDRMVMSIVTTIRTGHGVHDEESEALPRALACFKVALETEGWDKPVKLKSWKYVAAAVCLEQLQKYMNFFLRPL